MEVALKTKVARQATARESHATSSWTISSIIGSLSTRKFTQQDLVDCYDELHGLVYATILWSCLCNLVVILCESVVIFN